MTFFSILWFFFVLLLTFNILSLLIWVNGFNFWMCFFLVFLICLILLEFLFFMIWLLFLNWDWFLFDVLWLPWWKAMLFLDITGMVVRFFLILLLLGGNFFRIVNLSLLLVLLVLIGELNVGLILLDSDVFVGIENILLVLLIMVLKGLMLWWWFLIVLRLFLIYSGALSLGCRLFLNVEIFIRLNVNLGNILLFGFIFWFLLLVLLRDLLVFRFFRLRYLLYLWL